MQSPNYLRLGTACLVASLAFPAHAIYINEEEFKDAGGNVAAIDATVKKAFSARRARSFQAPFDASAVSRECSPTWIGNEGNFAWFLTAAHCLPHNNVTRFAISERFELQQAIVAEGTGWAFLPPDRLGSEDSATDIALVKLPLKSPAAEWTNITRPVLYDGSDEGDRQVHFVGHGNWGVGRTEVNGQPARGLPRRLWGTSDVWGTYASASELRAPYSPFGRSDFKARPTQGDSGSAWWQQHFGGYWTIVGTTTSGTSSWSYGVRMSKRTDWITGLFPGATTLTERLTVTESTPFVSRNHAEDVDAGTVHYVVPAGQIHASGPTAGIWSGAPTYSTITVKAHDRITGNVMPIILRGQRSHGCGLVRMEDAVMCYSDKQGPLTLRFEAADNPSLPSGSWYAKFDVEAVGWHRNYRERMPITVDIRNMVRARVTTTSPYLSPNFASLATRGTVYYLVPTQAKAQGPTQAIWKADHAPRFSTIRVTARNAVTLEERDVNLRAERHPGCGFRTWMENIPGCYDTSKTGPLMVEYNAADNPGLPKGLWRGQVYVQAKGWHDGSIDELIELEVALDTLQ